MSQGDFGGAMYAIIEGVVSVTFTDSGGRQQTVAKLGPGEVVGEMSLFTGDRRTATVAAETNVDALEIGKPALERVFARSPDLLDKFASVLASRQAELRAVAGHDEGHRRDEFLAQARRLFSGIFGRSGG